MPQSSTAVTAGTDATSAWANAVIADIAEIYAGGPGVPVGGVILWWSDNTIPLNYKACDGSVVSDVVSPLNGLSVPDMTDRFARGVANANLRTVPQSGGEDSHTLTIAEMPTHSHLTPTTTNLGGGIYEVASQQQSSYDYIGSAPTSEVGGGQAHNNIPAFRGFVYVMRIK